MEQAKVEAFTPAEIAKKIAEVAKKKSSLDFFRLFVLFLFWLEPHEEHPDRPLRMKNRARTAGLPTRPELRQPLEDDECVGGSHDARLVACR